MQYYMAIKRNEAPVDATTWTNPENIMQSKRSQMLSLDIFHKYDYLYMNFPELANPSTESGLMVA